jgi:Ca2+-binding EF-hand superfamily protein
MSNRQFWCFLDLDFIYNTKFAKLFYKTACEFNDNAKIEYIRFMDFTKFYQFVAIFTKNKPIDNINMKEMRIKFMFSLFDTDGSEEIDRLEFRNLITSFIEMILICKFDSEGIHDKVRTLSQESSNINMMEKVLDNYVDEVFNVYSYNGEFLSYEEWQKWFFSINGTDNLLDFTGSLR